jgi:hypothetical protein
MPQCCNNVDIGFDSYSIALYIVEIHGQYNIAACKLKKCHSNHIALPEGWIYERSLSREYAYAPSKHMDRSMKYLRHKNGLDVYLNLMTNEEVYVGRADEIFKYSEK